MDFPNRRILIECVSFIILTNLSGHDVRRRRRRRECTGAGGTPLCQVSKFIYLFI